MSIIVEILVKVAFQILEKLPEWIVGKLLGKIGREPTPSPPLDTVGPYASSCGDEGINLGQERLMVSTAFGTYFAGLLERERSYVDLKGQIECPTLEGVEKWEPIQRLFWALQHPKGPRLLIIAAEGGMGKSTLAAKVVRCLFEEQAVDMILGDSAKMQRADPTTGKVVQVRPGFYDTASFYRRICEQLGLPPPDGRRVLVPIKDRLFGRRGVIVVDNLETVKQGDELLHSLQTLTTRDIRAVVTAREVKGLGDLTSSSLVVHLRPLKELDVVRTFLEWHIRQHQGDNPRLQVLSNDLKDKKHIQWLVDRTGGIPLLIQLVFSDIARFSWEYLEELPRIFGDELLSFLYQERWDELGTLGAEGHLARDLLRWIAKEQYKGKKVTFEHLVQWAQIGKKTDLLTDTLRLLYERFLIVNHDPKRGDFALFPSLVEFVEQQTQIREMK